jgi:hypothetical protein
MIETLETKKIKIIPNQKEAVGKTIVFFKSTNEIGVVTKYNSKTGDSECIVLKSSGTKALSKVIPDTFENYLIEIGYIAVKLESSLLSIWGNTDYLKKCFEEKVSTEMALFNLEYYEQGIFSLESITKHIVVT